MLGRPMVLAGPIAKQVQWTNVYQDALVSAAFTRPRSVNICVAKNTTDIWKLTHTHSSVFNPSDVRSCVVSTGSGFGGDRHDARL